MGGNSHDPLHSLALISSSSLSLGHTATPSAHRCRKAHRWCASRVLRVLEGGDFYFLSLFFLFAAEEARRNIGQQEKEVRNSERSAPQWMLNSSWCLRPRTLADKTRGGEHADCRDGATAQKWRAHPVNSECPAWECSQKNQP